MNSAKPTKPPTATSMFSFSSTALNNRHARLVNSSSSSEDAGPRSREIYIYPHFGKHTRRRTMDHISVQNDFGVKPLQATKKRKGKPRRQSLPNGMTAETIRECTQFNQQETDRAARTTEMTMQQNKPLSVHSKQDQHHKRTATSISSSCLSQKQPQESNGHIISYKSSGCKVTISTSKRTTDYMKTMYTHTQDVPPSESGSDQLKINTKEQEIAGVYREQNKVNTIPSNIEKKTLDLKDKFEKKFTNASTFDCSFPITSSPISKEAAAQQQQPKLKPAERTELNSNNKNQSECSKFEFHKPAEIHPKARRRSSSLQRCQPVFRVKRDGQIPFRHQSNEIQDTVPKIHYPHGHFRSLSQESVTSSGNRLDFVDDPETTISETLPRVILGSQPSKISSDNATNIITDVGIHSGKQDGVVSQTSDNASNDDTKPKKTKGNSVDTAKLFERGKLRDSKRNVKNNKHKRTLSVPSDNIFDAKRHAMKKTARFGDKHLRLSKRKGRKLDTGQMLAPNPSNPQGPVSSQKCPDIQMKNLVALNAIYCRQEVQIGECRTSGDVGVTNGEAEINVSTLHDGNLSTAKSNCFPMISKVPTKHKHKWDKQLKDADTLVVAEPLEALCGEIRPTECLEAQVNVRGVVTDGSTDSLKNISATRDNDLALDKDCTDQSVKIVQNNCEKDYSPHKRGIDEPHSVDDAIKKTKLDFGPSMVSNGSVDEQCGKSRPLPCQHVDANDSNGELLNTVAGCIERLEKGIKLGVPKVESAALRDSLFLDSSQQLNYRTYSPDSDMGTILRNVAFRSTINSCSKSSSENKVDLGSVVKHGADSLQDNVPQIEPKSVKSSNTSNGIDMFKAPLLPVHQTMSQIQEHDVQEMPQSNHDIFPLLQPVTSHDIAIASSDSENRTINQLNTIHPCTHSGYYQNISVVPQYQFEGQQTGMAPSMQCNPTSNQDLSRSHAVDYYTGCSTPHPNKSELTEGTTAGSLSLTSNRPDDLTCTQGNLIQDAFSASAQPLMNTLLNINRATPAIDTHKCHIGLTTHMQEQNTVLSAAYVTNKLQHSHGHLLTGSECAHTGLNMTTDIQSSNTDLLIHSNSSVPPCNNLAAIASASKESEHLLNSHPRHGCIPQNVVVPSGLDASPHDLNIHAHHNGGQYYNFTTSTAHNNINATNTNNIQSSYHNNNVRLHDCEPISYVQDLGGHETVTRSDANTAMSTHSDVSQPPPSSSGMYISVTLS